MDFRTAKPCRQDHQADYDLLKLVGGGGADIAGGYDNHYALSKTTASALTLAPASQPLRAATCGGWAAFGYFASLMIRSVSVIPQYRAVASWMKPMPTPDATWPLASTLFVPSQFEALQR